MFANLEKPLPPPLETGHAAARALDHAARRDTANYGADLPGDVPARKGQDQDYRAGRRRGLRASGQGDDGMVISHVTDDRSAKKMRANSEVAEKKGAVLIPRGRYGRPAHVPTGASWSTLGLVEFLPAP